MLIKCVISSLKREEREVRKVNCLTYGDEHSTAPHFRENNSRAGAFVSFN